MVYKNHRTCRSLGQYYLNVGVLVNNVGLCLGVYMCRQAQDKVTSFLANTKKTFGAMHAKVVSVLFHKSVFL
ncbi:hypothetical protein HYC85_014825 [Camellia sinensis]|uniref:Uncharacterized protein n=1 Tax=Camellia sinensis TaxID=4442 RepID=A0A7J7HAM0_CAMSI|nr:hypothetical protein HYC85_014825 [Camellia sinensis]